MHGFTASFNRLLPRHIDNDHRGHRLALWLFGLVVLLKLGVSLGTLFNGREAAASADGIPLDTYAPATADAIVTLFAVWGLAQLMICLLCLLALVRYRAMIPFLFTLLLLEHLGRRLILFLLPIERTGTPPGFIINLVLGTALIVGLVLSLRNRAITE